MPETAAFFSAPRTLAFARGGALAASVLALFAALGPLMALWDVDLLAILATAALVASACIQWRHFLRLGKTALLYEDASLLVADGRTSILVPEALIRCVHLAVAIGTGFGGRMRSYRALSVNSRLLLIDLSSALPAKGLAARPGLPILPLEGASFAAFARLAEAHDWLKPPEPPPIEIPARRNRLRWILLFVLLAGCTGLLAFAPNRRFAIAALFGLFGAVGLLAARRAAGSSRSGKGIPPTNPLADDSKE